MNSKAALKRLERLTGRRRPAGGRGEWPPGGAVHQGHDHVLAVLQTLDDAGALVEVMPLPYRLYELDEDGRRVYVEPDEGELELDAKMRRLIHGR